MNNDLTYQFVKPNAVLEDYVAGFWSLQNESESDKEVVILPDGRIDLFFSQSTNEPFHVTLSGLETQSNKAVLGAKTIMFAISFKLLAIEYVLKDGIAAILDNAKYLPNNFWDFNATDLTDFASFCEKAIHKITSLLPNEIDTRKKKLFEIIYDSNGATTIKKLSEKVFWSSRQMNRYFNQQFGIPLKVYLSILRFRASFDDIKEGKLFPESNFADQSHFIKEVKKRSGVSPKKLKQNQNDRFIQFSTLPTK
ncbi:AraC family transcriptional regulator [Flavobacterium sp. J27]|uniref:helix-turn-helix domain-containing protein n=1 Tax=Flavobacterium sp. J27 TaxID=2060419 RepID=UPI00102FAC4E|nr:AraC family transcriptional regulator [Flavobacterium sp. J27]